MSLRSPIVLVGLLVLAALLVVVGVFIQLNPSLHDPAHAISRKAMACWAAAVAALVGASFARPGPAR